MFTQVRKSLQNLSQILYGTSSTSTPVTTVNMLVENGDSVQQKSPVKLDVIVVGAGISGLATAISTALSGHNVTVFESAKELLEVRSRPEFPPSPIFQPTIGYMENLQTHIPSIHLLMKRTDWGRFTSNTKFNPDPAKMETARPPMGGGR